MNETEPDAAQRSEWVLLADPHWQSPDPAQAPPLEMIVGGWPVDEIGDRGLFRPNPEYLPADDVPSDPVDAAVRRLFDGTEPADDIITTMRNAIVEIGCDETDQLVIGRAPDGAACVVVVTAAIQKRDIDIERWNPIPGAQLPQIVPAGVDIMLNPSGRAAFRLHTAALDQEQPARSPRPTLRIPEQAGFPSTG